MAVEIPRRYEYIPQATAYPQEEWTWRGIVDPAIVPLRAFIWTDESGEPWVDENNEEWRTE